MINFAARTKRMVPLFLQEVTGVIFDGASGHSSPKLGTHFVLSSILRWQLDQISRVARNFQIIFNRRTKIDQITEGSFGRWRDIPDSRPSEWNKVRLWNIDLWKNGSFQVKLSSKKLKTHGTRGFLANLYVFSRENLFVQNDFQRSINLSAPWHEGQTVNLYFNCDTHSFEMSMEEKHGEIFSTDVFSFSLKFQLSDERMGWEECAFCFEF